MRILDYGAGWKALHTVRMRALGLDVTAWDFGKNFDPAVHTHLALDRRYDVVMASNVVNVHSTIHGIERSIFEIANATRDFAVVNYPESPRKFCTVTPGKMAGFLQQAFAEVDRIPGRSCPLWVCRGPLWAKAVAWLVSNRGFNEAEIACANIRPAGAVGANALVPRFTLELLGNSIGSL